MDTNKRYGLWEKLTRAGARYYNGRIACPHCQGVSWLNVFENTGAENPRAPQMHALLNPAEDRTSGTVQQVNPRPLPQPTMTDEDIPF